ncbi:uncharacterized protein METZ01_LOCUS512685, partial [marine metagenome]
MVEDTPKPTNKTEDSLEIYPILPLRN